MKRLLLILFSLPLICMAQTVELSINGKTVVLESTKTAEFKVNEPDSNDQTIYLNFKTEDNHKSQKVLFKIQDRNDGTASLNKDYLYTEGTLDNKIIDKTSGFFTVSIKLLTDVIPEVEEYINLTVFQETEEGTITYLLKISISDAADPSKNKAESSKSNKSDTSKWELRIVTGSNFDFFEAPRFKDFAGEINLFVPNIWKKIKIGKLRPITLGLQFGIYNFRYFEADSSMGMTRTERYLEKPNFTELVPGTNYIQETYSLDTKTDHNLWGWHLNPMITLDENDWASVYFNLHLEGMVRTTTIVPTKISRRIDTLTITEADIQQGKLFNSAPLLQSEYSKNVSYESYIGFGLPVRLMAEKKFMFHVDPTLGFALFDSRRLVEIDEDGIKKQRFVTERQAQPFFLFKGQILTKVAPVDLALGWELRKVVRYDTYVAMYLGATITLDKLKR